MKTQQRLMYGLILSPTRANFQNMPIRLQMFVSILNTNSQHRYHACIPIFPVV
jgi:hypothetical protein